MCCDWLDSNHVASLNYVILDVARGAVPRVDSVPWLLRALPARRIAKTKTANNIVLTAWSTYSVD